MAPSYLPDLLTYRRSWYSLRPVSNDDLLEPSSLKNANLWRSIVCSMSPQIVELFASFNT